MAPARRRLARYRTLSFEEVEELPVGSIANDTAHLYLWVPNALLTHGLRARPDLSAPALFRVSRRFVAVAEEDSRHVGAAHFLRPRLRGSPGFGVCFVRVRAAA